jgi:hypothetical protein
VSADRSREVIDSARSGIGLPAPNGPPGSGWIGRHFLWTALAVFACRAAMALLVVPPWQHPDEPQHVLWSRIISRQQVPDPTVIIDVPAEAEIVTSMAANGWWRHYGLPTPDPPSMTFAHGPYLVNRGVGSLPGGPAAYYLVTGRALRWLNVTELMPQLYALRILSGVLALATLWIAWLGAVNWLGRGAALGVVTLMALHPQFVLISTAASPDAVVNLLGVVVWWQAGRFAAGRGVMAAVLCVAAGVAAIFVRRAGLSVAAWTVATIAAAAWRAPSSRPLRVAAGIVATLLLPVAFIWWIVPGEISRMIHHVSDFADPRYAIPQGRWFVVDFVRTMSDTFWLVGGWLTHPAPGWWQMAVRGLMIIALAGLVVGSWHGTLDRRRIVLLALPILVQLSALVATYYRIGVLAQGRYLFPVLAPILALLWIGVRAIAPTSCRRYVPAALMTAMAALDLVAWGWVLVPAFLV